MLANMDSTAICNFMANICIFLFFFVSASKFNQLLITNHGIIAKNPNRIQREFHSNVAIATQEFSSASKHPRKNTNFFKPSFPLFLCASALSFYLLLLLRRTLTSRRRKEGWGVGIALPYSHPIQTNRIQREFLFNNGIQSQKYFSYSESKPPKANQNKLSEIVQANKAAGNFAELTSISLRRCFCSLLLAER
jgi:hypothetical protein